MEQLIVLGTGNAMVTRVYNTCFALSGDGGLFLVDGGGGNGILRQAASAGIAFENLHHAFLSHSHTDHIFGMVWVIREVAARIRQGKYEGVFTVYGHRELTATLRAIADMTLVPGMVKLLGERILFQPVEDGETRRIMGRDITFFDIHSTKEKQFGFTAVLANGRKFTFLGDEPYNDRCEAYARDSDWLCSEAFCLYAEREIFKPYEKHHSTVREACELAERMEIPNLVLWHTEDKGVETRGQTYVAEGRQYYKGNLFVPEDLDVIPL